MTAISEPGIYDMTDAEYQGDPCSETSLRSSVAWLMHSKTPAHAAWALQAADEHGPHFDTGKRAHMLLFGKGAEIELINALDYRKKDAQSARDAAYLAGHIPTLAHEFDDAQDMLRAAQNQIAALVEAGTIPESPFSEELSEKVLIWRDHGVLCRSMMDGWQFTHDTLSEYKTEGESASPDKFMWKARRMGYIFRLAFYRRGLEALNLSFSPNIHIFVQETAPPYLLAFYRIDDELIARADEQIIQVLRRWKRCLETNNWPGYDTAGYDLSLLDKERAQDDQQTPRSAHVLSEDVGDDAYSPIRFHGKGKK